MNPEEMEQVKELSKTMFKVGALRMQVALMKALLHEDVRIFKIVSDHPIPEYEG